MIMRSSQRTILTSVLVAAMVLTAFLTAAAEAQMQRFVERLPADAHVVVLVPSLNQLSVKLATMNRQLGLDMSELQDALGNFKLETGMIQGLNENAPIALVLTNVNRAMDEQGEPDAYFLVPVSDYPAFIGNYGAVEADGVTAVRMPGGMDGFVRHLDGYAVMGPQRDLVANFTPANDADLINRHIGQAGRTYFNQADMLVYFNLKAMGPALVDLANTIRAELMQEMGLMGGLGGMDGMFDEAASMIRMYTHALTAVADSSDGMLLALELADAGIAMTTAIQYNAGTPLAELMPAGEANTKPLLDKLPVRPYVLAFAMDNNVLDVEKLMDAILSVMPEDDATARQQRKMMPLVRMMTGMSQVLYAPDPMAMMGGGGLINAVTITRVEDGAAYLAANKAYMAQLNGMETPSGMTDDQGNELNIITETHYTENALQLDGVRVDQYQMQVRMPDALLMEMGPMASMMGMLTDRVGYIAAKGDYVITTTTADPQLVTQALRELDGNQGVGSDQILRDLRAKAMPENVVMEGYCNLAGIAKSLNEFLVLFGVEALTVPDDLPPMAMGIGSKDDSMTFRMYMPHSTARWLVEVFNELSEQMDADMAPGMGPGQGPPPAPF